MNKTIMCIFLLLSLVCIKLNALPLSQDPVLEDEPKLTWNIVDGHIKLIEFVLQTRLTVRQKNAFLNAMKEEIPQMSEEDKDGLMQSLELIENLNLIDEDLVTEVRTQLKEDFFNVATEMPDDPASKLFKTVDSDCKNFIFDPSISSMTRQSAMALAEYLAFVADPDNPQWYDLPQVKLIAKIINDNLDSLDEDAQAMLDDFQLDWYMIRVGWQAVEDPSFIKSVKELFATANITKGKIPNIEAIKIALSTDLYADLIDIAAYSYASPLEWTPGPEFRVW